MTQIDLKGLKIFFILISLARISHFSYKKEIFKVADYSEYTEELHRLFFGGGGGTCFVTYLCFTDVWIEGTVL